MIRFRRKTTLLDRINEREAPRMPACQSVFTNEDEQMLAEAVSRADAGTNARLSPGLRAQIESPEFRRDVDSAIEQRCLALLEENDKQRQNELSERMRQKKEKRLLDEIDHDQWPTKLERTALYDTGKHLGMTPAEILNLPPIKVIGPDSETTVGIIVETLKELHSSKIPRAMWAEYAINKIAFIDQRAVPYQSRGNVAGYVDPISVLQDDRSRLGVVHVISDDKGEFRTGSDLLWILSHEICHLHEVESSGVFRLVHDMNHWEEWKNAVAAQLQVGPVSYYSVQAPYESGQVGTWATRDPDEIEDISMHPDFICEHFAAWVTDMKRDGHPNPLLDFKAEFLCSEMREFFDKYIPDTFAPE